MPHSRRSSSSERRSEPNHQPIISQPEPRQLAERGEGRRRNEFSSEPDSQRDQASTNRPEEKEVDRPDLELNYQGNSLVIDMSRIEWIALAIIILSVTSTIYLLR